MLSAAKHLRTEVMCASQAQMLRCAQHDRTGIPMTWQ
jgi:hypothetical protein